MKKKYIVTITRTWEREVEAENVVEAESLAYDEIDPDNGDDFDGVEIEEYEEE